jgi:hypothetical protein
MGWIIDGLDRSNGFMNWRFVVVGCVLCCGWVCSLLRALHNWLFDVMFFVKSLTRCTGMVWSGVTGVSHPGLQAVRRVSARLGGGGLSGGGLVAAAASRHFIIRYGQYPWILSHVVLLTTLGRSRY